MLSTGNNTYSWRIKYQSCVWKFCNHVCLWHWYSISCKLSFVTSLHFSRELPQLRPSTYRSQKGSEIQVSLTMVAIWSKPQLISITSPGNGTWKKESHVIFIWRKKGVGSRETSTACIISIDKFWCDADSVKQQLLAAGRSTIRFSTKVTSNSTRHWQRMTRRKSCYNKHDLSDSLSHLVFKGKKVAVHQVLLCILPLPSTPRLNLHPHCGTKDQTHLFRNPLIFSRTKPESAEGPSSPGVQWSRIWEQNNSQTSRKRHRCCSTPSTGQFWPPN